MREILFTGKTKDGKWIQGSYHPAYTDSEGDRWPDIIYDQDDEHFSKEVIPETVGQYTGRFDLNQVKAFDGNIFKDQNGNEWVISYSESRCAFYAGKKNSEWQKSKLLGDLEIAQIIGNIHDNPELLK